MENLIAIAADSEFVTPAWALLRSIERNWRPYDASLSYLVLDCGLDARDRERLADAGRGDVRFHSCAFEAHHASAIQQDSHLSLATFARFELFRLISELPARCILYIDSDALVLTDCRDIWETKGVFVARWRSDIFLPGEYRPGFEAALRDTDAADPFLEYLNRPGMRPFNAGVLLLRKDPIHREVYRRLHQDMVRYNSYFVNADQSALNLVALRLGIVNTLPYKYNVPQRELLRSAETSILHFVGKRKPWLPETLPGGDEEGELDRLRREIWSQYAPKA